MIHPYLIHPRSIAVVGATDNLQAPGGRLMDNLIRHGYKGKLYPVNPKKERLYGLKVYPAVDALPAQVDTAIIAVAAKYVEDIVKTLTRDKGTRGFIIISAGFSDAGPDGAELEKRIVSLIDEVGGTLLGPNNIGLINRHYAGVFTTPVPALDENGVDLISGSGATAVFIIEAAMQRGMRFNSVWTVGNSAQTGIEEILEYIDTAEGDKPRVIMLYMEQIRKPFKLLKHARSLREKGFYITAIKAGNSRAGSRAAASHTGAMATPSLFSRLLFKKAGILPAEGRFDLIDKAMVMTFPRARGKRVGIVTHAGGPAVMLTDTLETNGMEVPPITHPDKEKLKALLYPGASVENPIDILATGTAEQLDAALDYAINVFDEIDMVPVIFGSPGLFPVYAAYDVILEKMKNGAKSVFPILPSVVNVKDEIQYFINKGGSVFFDEVSFGKALSSVYNMPALFETDMDKAKPFFRESNDAGRFLTAAETRELLEKYGLPVVEQEILNKETELDKIPASWYPLVLKAIGPLHKTEAGAVRLNINHPDDARRHFRELMQLENVDAVLVQPFVKGYLELFAGVHNGGMFGKALLFGKGGIDVEIWQDVRKLLLPVSRQEAEWETRRLKIYPFFEGFRNMPPVPMDEWIDLLLKINKLVMENPSLSEMDLNPVLVTSGGLKIVDARVKM